MNEVHEIESFLRRAQWHQRNNKLNGERLQPLNGEATTLIQGLKIIPNYKDVRIRKAEAELKNAKTYGPKDRITRAEAQLKRARLDAGLTTS